MDTPTQQFAAKVFPDTVRVFGVRLLPLTVGQALLLVRLGNPLMLGGQAKASHTVTALFVLSRDYKVAASALQKRRTRWLLRAWAWQMRLLSDAAVDEAKRTIHDHISGAFTFPPVWEEEGEKNPVPLLLALAARAPASWADPLDLPIARALWESAVPRDGSGPQWVSRDKEEAIFDCLNRHG